MYGKITPEEMQDFTRSVGRKNPLETALIWKTDFDQALISLSPTSKGWDPAEITSGEIILQIARSNHIGNMQRSIISDCILKNCNKICKRTPRPETCWNEGIITRMRKTLNGEWLAANGRTPDGKIKGVKQNTAEPNAPST
jgi:hypothetical protein